MTMRIAPTSAIAKATYGRIPVSVYCAFAWARTVNRPASSTRERRAVPEPRLAQQVHRPEAQPRGDVDRADQVPDPVQRLAPADGAAQELGARRDPVPDHADRPDQLVRAPPLQPLVQQEQREHEAQRDDRRGSRTFGCTRGHLGYRGPSPGARTVSNRHAAAQCAVGSTRRRLPGVAPPEGMDRSIPIRATGSTRRRGTSVRGHPHRPRSTHREHPSHHLARPRRRRAHHRHDRPRRLRRRAEDHRLCPR